MYKTTATVEGMMCNMCEAHVQEAVRNAFDGAKKVKADHKKNQLSFVTKEAPDIEALKKTITDTGYTFVGAETSED